MNQETDSASKYYYVGGSLPSNAPSYVKRKADEDIYNYLKAREYCYVLNSRQMGKSSLRVQTKKKLEDDKIVCASIDITAFGSGINVTIEQWYTSLINRLSKELNLLEPLQFKNWVQDHQSFSPVENLSKFIEEVILKCIKQNIVIFIDEIDSVRNLKFSSDEFFAFLRSCYNLRVDNPEYKRLTFCLLGVATPSDLIKDKKSTPFNIGKKVHLDGFKLEEASILSNGLEAVAIDPKAVIEQILYWTNGQPFLTQKLCYLLSNLCEKIPLSLEKKVVEELVKSKIIKDWEAQDEPQHLKTIRDAIVFDKQHVRRVIGLYYKIKESRKVESDNSSEEWTLRLSGLIIHDSGKLIVHNRIYRRVFDKRWINNELGKWQTFTKDMIAWLDSGCQDKSLLLQGELLRDALASVEEQSLNDDGYKFLIASLKAENVELKKGLDLQVFRQTKAAKSNQFLEQVPKGIFKFVKWGIILWLVFIGIHNKFLEILVASALMVFWRL